MSRWLFGDIEVRSPGLLRISPYAIVGRGSWWFNSVVQIVRRAKTDVYIFDRRHSSTAAGGSELPAGETPPLVSKFTTRSPDLVESA
ncbi:MAG: hypothetical protein GY903_12370 [Fuerstiella sp.]|nr:hypothetical protein [Fuerstiella sp.]MCP4855277.1 hypothetical protein [Fuerstiella sp.]